MVGESHDKTGCQGNAYLGKDERQSAVDDAANLLGHNVPGFATRALHAGYDPYEHGAAVSVPVYQSAAFTLHDADRGDGLSSGDIDGFSYSRCGNPTVDALERRIASLEGGVEAVALASGMAAVSYALLCAAEGGRSPHRRQGSVRCLRGCVERLLPAVRYPH